MLEYPVLQDMFYRICNAMQKMSVAASKCKCEIIIYIEARSSHDLHKCMSSVNISEPGRLLHTGAPDETSNISGLCISAAIGPQKHTKGRAWRRGTLP